MRGGVFRLTFLLVAYTDDTGCSSFPTHCFYEPESLDVSRTTLRCKHFMDCSLRDVC